MNFSELLTVVTDLLWSAPMIFSLLLLFAYISWRAGLPQKYIPAGLRAVFSGGSGVFRSLSVSLAAVLGVGNIVGVALAISLGGPGAVFWCWMAGLIGVGVQYAECLLSLKYRKREADGVLRGGPMVTMKVHGYHFRASLYAVSATLCGLTMGALIPANAIREVLVPGGEMHMVLAVAIMLTLLSALVLFGGARRIFAFCAGAIPFLVLLYLAMLLVILYLCRSVLPDAVLLILREAFRPHSLVSGAAGYGIGRAARWGVARGLFSSEAGLGTAAISASSSESADIVQQSMGCACQTVWDTLILAGLTGLSFVAAALYGGYGFAQAMGLAERAFLLLPVIGRYVMPFFLLILGFSTVIGWYYIAEQTFLYLTGGRGRRFFTAVWILAVFSGTLTAMDLIWTLSDLFSMLMLLPNLSMLLMLLPQAERMAERLKLMNKPVKKPEETQLFDHFSFNRKFIPKPRKMQYNEDRLRKNGGSILWQKKH